MDGCGDQTGAEVVNNRPTGIILHHPCSCECTENSTPQMAGVWLSDAMRSEGMWHGSQNDVAVH